MGNMVVETLIVEEDVVLLYNFSTAQLVKCVTYIMILLKQFGCSFGSFRALRMIRYRASVVDGQKNLAWGCHPD
jgi:hypothetical protein